MRYLNNNLLNYPRKVQRWCVMGLASGEESCNCRQQIGRWASWLLRILSRRWIPLNQDVDSGSQGENIENVDVIVLTFRPPVSKVQKLKGKECTVGREISSSRKVTLEVNANCTSARMREEVALESTAGRSPTSATISSMASHDTL